MTEVDKTIRPLEKYCDYFDENVSQLDMGKWTSEYTEGNWIFHVMTDYFNI